MNNRLKPIILQKQYEIRALQALIRDQPQHLIAQTMLGKIQREWTKSLKKMLRQDSLAVIAEIKRKSPSKGTLAMIKNPASLANEYIAGGAAALSVLTDETFFGGTLEDLQQVALSLHGIPNPILRKDFIIDEIQIAESIIKGADAILCIVAILGDKTASILKIAKNMGIEALVEVHNEQELEIALASGAEIIGINNRNLNTLQVDTMQAFKLLDAIPKHIVRVAESGILMPELAQEYYRAGFDAVLIGEALVKSEHPADFIKACRDA